MSRFDQGIPCCDVYPIFFVGERTVDTNMIIVTKKSGNIDCWEAVRFPVERKENDQVGRLRIIYPHLLIWEGEIIRLPNADRLVDCCNQ